MIDLASEILQVWQIEHPEFDLTFTQTPEIPHTRPHVVDGRLQVEVRGDSSDRATIVFHEGAHVYLFHIGYPPAPRTIINTTIPMLTGPPVDFLAEHYAQNLELGIRFNLQSERLNELRDRLNDALARLPIRGYHHPQPGSGVLPMKIASCAQLLSEWNATADVRQANVLMDASFGDHIAIYHRVLESLHQAPPLPPQSQRFTNAEVLHIKAIMTSAIDDIYKGSCMLEFL